MRVKLLLVGLALGFVSFGASRVYADTITEPGHFIVNLNADCSTNPTDPECTVPDGTGGWTPNSTFTDEVNPGISTRGFTPSFCQDPDNDNDCDVFDPSIRINPGGGSSPFPSNFMVDEDGGGIFDFQNDSGSPYTQLLFITNYIPDGEYTCDGTSFFSFCGFKIVNDGNQKEIEILFSGGSIPTTSTPEPAEYFFLVGACATVVVLRRLRSRGVAH